MNNKQNKKQPEENQKETSKVVKEKNVKTTNHKVINWVWSVKVLFLTLALSIMFSVLSELALTSASIIIALLVITMLMLLGIVFDCIGVATTACNVEPFLAMASRKVKGAKESIALIKNAEKVSVFCCDIVGDVCGILCGAAGAAIVIKFIGEGADPTLSILVSALVSGVIAGLTIFGKSIEKGIAVNKAENIMMMVGKVLSIFTRNK